MGGSVRGAKLERLSSPDWGWKGDANSVLELLI